MASMETIRIKLPPKFKSKLKTDYQIINLVDYNPAIHTPYDVDEEVKAAIHSSEWKPNVEQVEEKPEHKEIDNLEYVPSFEVVWDQILEDDKFIEDCHARGLDPQLCVYSMNELHKYAQDRFYTWIPKATEFDDMVRQIMLMEAAADEVYELDDIVEGYYEDDLPMDISVDDFEWEIVDEDNDQDITLNES